MDGINLETLNGKFNKLEGQPAFRGPKLKLKIQGVLFDKIIIRTDFIDALTKIVSSKKAFYIILTREYNNCLNDS